MNGLKYCLEYRGECGYYGMPLRTVPSFSRGKLFWPDGTERVTLTRPIKDWDFIIPLPPGSNRHRRVFQIKFDIHAAPVIAMQSTV